MKITQATAIKAQLPADKLETIYWDEEMPGFGLRLRSGGSRTFIVQYKIGSKNRRTSLGNAFKVTADDARKRAKQIFGKVVSGYDPANEKAARIAEASTGFGAAVADFLKVQAKRNRARTLIGTTYNLNKKWKPLHGMALASITRAHVATELRRIANETSAQAADRARSTLSTFFAWAIGEGLCETNPVMGTNKAAGDQLGRARVLTDGETAAIWNATDPATDFGKIVRLLLTTGCRRSEIGGLRASEVRLGDSLIALPGERTKNGLPHEVPLSGLARGIAESLNTEREGCLFSKSVSGFNNWDRAKKQLDAALPPIEEAWTLHDIRRTVATRMADLGVQPHIIEAALNHVSGYKKGVAGTYNRSTYAKEKKAAFDTWGSHLETLLSGASNVRRLARG